MLSSVEKLLFTNITNAVPESLKLCVSYVVSYANKKISHEEYLSIITGIQTVSLK